jgi:DNA-binding NtrC family response regulator
LYRLEVFTINLPPLRERWEDIPAMVKHFISIFNKEMNRNIRSVTREALDYLTKYEWPGNVRELKNVIQRAILLAKKNVITLGNLPDRIMAGNVQKKDLSIEIGLPLKEIERRYIEKTLWWTRGNKIEAAKLLGITRKTLYNKIEEYNI